MIPFTRKTPEKTYHSTIRIPNRTIEEIRPLIPANEDLETFILSLIEDFRLSRLPPECGDCRHMPPAGGACLHLRRCPAKNKWVDIKTRACSLFATRNTLSYLVLMHASGTFRVSVPALSEQDAIRRAKAQLLGDAEEGLEELDPVMTLCPDGSVLRYFKDGAV